jgi:hypothetical protein
MFADRLDSVHAILASDRQVLSILDDLAFRLKRQ